MRKLFDGQPIRLSLLIVTITSVAATAVILTGAGGRTPAQRAALVALHEPPAARTVKVVAAAPSQPSGAGGVVQSAAPSDSGSVGGGAGTGGAATGGGSAATGGGGGSVGGETVGGGETTGAGETSNGGGTSGGDGSGGGGSGSGGSGSGDGSGSGGSSGGQTVPSGDANLPKVGHVFEIGLSTTGYQAALGDKAATYLRSLTRQGTVLSGYRSLGSSELADELASVSGQLPNPDTRGGCTTFTEFKTGAVANAKGFVPGHGCVYPETALTIGDQVTSSGHTWGAFVADQGKQACVHPNSNAVDDVALPFTDPGYTDRHNPFVYFHSLLDLGDCSSDDVDLTKLPAALRSAAKTPTLTYVAPDVCADARAVATSGSGTTGTTNTTGTTTTTGTSTTTPGATATTPGAATPAPVTSTPTPGTSTTTTTTTTTTSTTGTGTTGTGSSTTTGPLISGALGLPTAAACPSGPVGIAAEDAFLRTWVPRILHSSAYRQDGVLVIAFSGDGTKASGPQVRTGALVLSRWTQRGAKVATAYTPYSLLRSVEDMLRYQRLAEAATAKSFAAAVFHKLH
jgi:hypothetical protein